MCQVQIFIASVIRTALQKIMDHNKILKLSSQKAALKVTASQRSLTIVKVLVAVKKLRCTVTMTANI